MIADTGGLSTRAVRLAFARAIDTAIRIYGPVRQECVWNYESINEGTFHPRVAAKIVGLSFLSIVVAWEEYLKDSFLRYMAGAQSEAGYSPTLRIGKCANSTHAAQVLTGNKNMNEAIRSMRWNDYDWVIDKAEIFFQRAAPYARVSGRFRQRLKDAQVIRNRVAHSSSAARNNFKRMANANIGSPGDSALDPGFSPGQYLIYNKPEIVFDKTWLEAKDCQWPDIYECYVHMYLELACTITPHNECSI